jgi:DNA excision repair protein ERCC-6-like 2
MGLGKTVQVAALIAALLGKTGQRSIDIPALRESRRAISALISDESQVAPKKIRDPFGPLPILVLAPKSVLGNWKKELDKWGFIESIVSTEDRAQKEGMVTKAAKGLVEVIIMTPESATGLQGAFAEAANDSRGFAWGLVVIDEAHQYLKNPKTKTYKFIASLRARARLSLTGTPMQNNLMEVFSLLNVTCRNVGTREDFKSFYATPIENSILRTHTSYELVLGQQRQKLFNERIFERNVLQRKKADVTGLELPKKTETVVYCTLSELQTKAYTNALKSADFNALANAGDGTHFDSSGPIWNWQHPTDKECGACPQCMLMPCIIKLQKICNHLEILKPIGKAAMAYTPHRRELEWQFMETILGPEGMTSVGGRNHGRLEHLVNTANCGKLVLLQKMLAYFDEDKEAKHKIILFTKSKQLLKVLCDWLQDKYRGRFLQFSGDITQSEDRTRIVKDFNENERYYIMLLTTQSGGVGLNLTSADTVILFDPSWNPSKDVQAQDRAYRIGQKRDVKVYRFLTLGTIEEVMYLRQTFKVHLANRAISNTIASRFFMADDVRGKLTLMTFTPGGLTAQIFAKYLQSIEESNLARLPRLDRDERQLLQVQNEDPEDEAGEEVGDLFAVPVNVPGGWQEAPDMLAEAREEILMGGGRPGGRAVDDDDDDYAGEGLQFALPPPRARGDEHDDDPKPLGRQRPPTDSEDDEIRPPKKKGSAMDTNFSQEFIANDDNEEAEPTSIRTTVDDIMAVARQAEYEFLFEGPNSGVAQTVEQFRFTGASKIETLRDKAARDAQARIVPPPPPVPPTFSAEEVKHASDFQRAARAASAVAIVAAAKAKADLLNNPIASRQSSSSSSAVAPASVALNSARIQAPLVAAQTRGARSLPFSGHSIASVGKPVQGRNVEVLVDMGEDEEVVQSRGGVSEVELPIVRAPFMRARSEHASAPIIPAPVPIAAPAPAPTTAPAPAPVPASITIKPIGLTAKEIMKLREKRKAIRDAQQAADDAAADQLLTQVFQESVREKFEIIKEKSEKSDQEKASKELAADKAKRMEEEEEDEYARNEEKKRKESDKDLSRRNSTQLHALFDPSRSVANDVQPKQPQQQEQQEQEQPQKQEPLQHQQDQLQVDEDEMQQHQDSRGYESEELQID